MISELKDLIVQLRSDIAENKKTIETLKNTIAAANAREAEKDLQIKNLLAELAFLKTKLFGSVSERGKGAIDGQINLFQLANGTIQEEPPQDEQIEDEENPSVIEPDIVAGTEQPKSQTQRRPRPSYDKFFENIPTRDVMVDSLSDEEKVCSVCGEKMIPIGQEILRTELIYKKPTLERINYVGTTYACPNCKDVEGDNTFVKDKCEPALIEGSYVSNGLAAHVMFAKFVMALPLNRLEQEFSALGVKISRTTMANWVITCSEKYLEPMYKYFRRQLLKRKYLMADETPIQVLKEEDRRPQSKSYVWLIRTGEDGGIPIILFNYTPTRARKNIEKVLQNAENDFYLMVDGYQGYNSLSGSIRCCCYAHLRRYFVRAIPKGHEADLMEPAVQGVMYCDKLFRFEKMYAEKGYSAEQKRKHRLKDEEPIIDAFLQWADRQQPEKGDGLRKALTYLNNCRPYMKNYLKDGNCSFSNNWSENSLRGVVVGRKNWLFSNSTDGADANMRVFTIVETAKANGLDQEAYLNFLLEHRPSADMTDDQLEALAPWSKAAQESCKLK